MKFFSLQEFVEKAEDTEGAALRLTAGGLLPPQTLSNLRKLQRLDLLTDEVIFSLIGQAPIDPAGLYGAMRSMGTWAFQPLDFTVVQVLAKKGEVPVALMRLDLMSDVLTFVVLKDGQLVEHEVLTPEQLLQQMREPGMTEMALRGWLTDKMRAAIKVGRGDKD